MHRVRAPHRRGEIAAARCNIKAPAHITLLHVQVPGCTAAAELDFVLNWSPIPAGGFASMASTCYGPAPALTLKQQTTATACSDHADVGGAGVCSFDQLVCF